LIPDDVIQSIKDRSDIVQVVGEYVRLKPSGKNHKGLCPFHTEKTPSFTVSPHKGIFHCFGCGKGGNVFTFLMELKGLAFPDAVRLLGERAGISVQEQAGTTERDSLVHQLYRVNKEAADVYGKNLRSQQGSRALEYLKRRHFTRQSVQHFLVGYAFDEWDQILSNLRAEGNSPEILEKAGLVVKRKSGEGHYDRFRNRIMFPIQDSIGRFIGFGGRALETGRKDTGSRDDGFKAPKYINTNESPVFHKGRSLYGLYQAEQHIRRHDRVFITEGYIDVIRMFQAGFPNTVAPLGTALTGEQVDLLLRYTRNLYLLFDPDEAGRKAALNSTALVHARGVDPWVVLLPGETDPGDFFDTYSTGDFQTLVDESRSGIYFILESTAKKKKKFTAQEKISILQALSAHYHAMSDEILRSELLGRAAERLELDRSMIDRELRKHGPSGPKRDSGPPLHIESNEKKKLGGSKHVEAELRLLLLILSHPELLPIARSRIDGSYFDGKYTRLLWQSVDRAAETSGWDASTVMELVGDRDFEQYLSGRLMDEVLDDRPKEQLVDLIAALKQKRIRKQLADINRRLEEAALENDEDLVTELSMEKNSLKNEEQKITLLRKNKYSI
jgi:DNA primase